MTSIIAIISPSKDVSTVDGSPEQAYRTFMSRNELKTTSLGLWNRVFYETKLNKVGTSSSFSRIVTDTCHIERCDYVLPRSPSNSSRNGRH